MPIQLTDCQRRSWASSPSELSSFLINISELLIEIIAPKALKNEKSEYSQLFSQVSTKILQYISSENFNVLALSGAYFRHQKKEGLITWTVADNNGLNALLGPYRQEASASAYLNSFSTEERSASEAHCAFLRRILFADLEPLVAKDKRYDDLLASAIKVIDFLTTPYAVLFEEAEVHKKTTSGTDLQWSSMQKGLKGAVDALFKMKTKSVTAFKKPISSRLQAQAAKMEKDLQIFQSCLAVENVRLEAQAHYLTLSEKYERLQKRHDELSDYIRSLSPELPKTTPLEDCIRAYGEHWQASYEKLKLQNFKKQYEESLAEQETLRQQIKAKQAEIEKLVQKAPPLPLKQPLEDLKAKCDKLLEENKALMDKASELANAQTLMTPENNPQKMPFIAWIKNLLNQLKNLQQAMQQANKAIATLKQNNKELAAENQHLKDQLQTGFDSSPAMMHPHDEAVPRLETWESLLQQHCTGTNSTGVKEIMAEIKKLQKKAWPETEKLSMLSLKMREIAAARKDSHWSKSHFFGKGRHQGVQSLYTLMADDAFSLHNKACCRQLQDIFNTTRFVHGKNENREEEKPLLIQ